MSTPLSMSLTAPCSRSPKDSTLSFSFISSRTDLKRKVTSSNFSLKALFCSKALFFSSISAYKATIWSTSAFAVSLQLLALAIDVFSAVLVLGRSCFPFQTSPFLSIIAFAFLLSKRGKSESTSCILSTKTCCSVATKVGKISFITATTFFMVSVAEPKMMSSKRSGVS